MRTLCTGSHHAIVRKYANTTTALLLAIRIMTLVGTVCSLGNFVQDDYVWLSASISNVIQTLNSKITTYLFLLVSNVSLNRAN